MLTIKKEEITRAIRIVAKTLGTKDPMKGILMQFQGGAMILTARREDAQSYIKIPCEGDDGQFYVPGKQFCDVVNAAMSMPDAHELVLEEDNGVLRVKVGKVLDTAVPMMDAQTFTNLDQVSETLGTMTLSADILKGAVKKVGFAVSQDEARPILKGMCFQLGEGTLKVTALDGFRLAHTKFELANEQVLEFIIPGASLAAIKDEFVGEVEVTVGSKVVSFLSGGVKFVLPRLTGDYIKYEQIIPKEFPATFSCQRKEFDGVLRVLEAVIEQKEYIVLRPSEGGIQTTNKNASTTLNMQGQWDGSEMVIGMNPRYLKAAPFDGDALRFQFAGPVSPCIITDPADAMSLYLVLPTRVAETAAN